MKAGGTWGKDRGRGAGHPMVEGEGHGTKARESYRMVAGVGLWGAGVACNRLQKEVHEAAGAGRGREAGAGAHRGPNAAADRLHGLAEEADARRGREEEADALCGREEADVRRGRAAEGASRAHARKMAETDDFRENEAEAYDHGEAGVAEDRRGNAGPDLQSVADAHHGTYTSGAHPHQPEEHACADTLRSPVADEEGAYDPLGMAAGPRGKEAAGEVRAHGMEEDRHRGMVVEDHHRGTGAPYVRPHANLLVDDVHRDGVPDCRGDAIPVRRVGAVAYRLPANDGVARPPDDGVAYPPLVVGAAHPPLVVGAAYHLPGGGAPRTRPWHKRETEAFCDPWGCDRRRVD